MSSTRAATAAARCQEQAYARYQRNEGAEIIWSAKRLSRRIIQRRPIYQLST